MHVARHMNVPVFDGDHIVIVAGVGNKEEPYDESDVRQLRLLMQGMWQLVQRRRADRSRSSRAIAGPRRAAAQSDRATSRLRPSPTSRLEEAVR